MNLKDRARLELDENQSTDSNDTVEKWKQLLEETTELLKKEKVNNASLKREKQKLQEQVAKLEKEKKELQEEITELEEDNRSWRSNQDYMNGLLEREQRATRYQYHRVAELEEEIKILRNRPWWKKLWEDIKPKKRYSYGYSRWYKWKEFLGKVFWGMLAVAYAMAVFVGIYWFMRCVV